MLSLLLLCALAKASASYSPQIATLYVADLTHETDANNPVRSSVTYDHERQPYARGRVTSFLQDHASSTPKFAGGAGVSKTGAVGGNVLWAESNLEPELEDITESFSVANTYLVNPSAVHAVHIGQLGAEDRVVSPSSVVVGVALKKGNYDGYTFSADKAVPVRIPENIEIDSTIPCPAETNFWQYQHMNPAFQRVQQIWQDIDRKTNPYALVHQLQNPHVDDWNDFDRDDYFLQFVGRFTSDNLLDDINSDHRLLACKEKPLVRFCPEKSDRMTLVSIWDPRQDEETPDATDIKPKVIFTCHGKDGQNVRLFYNGLDGTPSAPWTPVSQQASLPRGLNFRLESRHTPVTNNATGRFSGLKDDRPAPIARRVTNDWETGVYILAIDYSFSPPGKERMYGNVLLSHDEGKTWVIPEAMTFDHARPAGALVGLCTQAAPTPGKAVYGAYSDSDGKLSLKFTLDQGHKWYPLKLEDAPNEPENDLDFGTLLSLDCSTRTLTFDNRHHHDDTEATTLF